MKIKPLRKQKRLKRIHQIKIRFGEDEMDHLRQVAEDSGQPMAALIRESIGKCKSWTAEDRAGIRALTIQLAKIGNNINQIARFCNTKPDADAAQVLLFLAELETELNDKVKTQCTSNS